MILQVSCIVMEKLSVHQGYLGGLDAVQAFQGFSKRVYLCITQSFSIRGHFAVQWLFDNVWKQLWLSQVGGIRLMQWVEAQDAAKAPPVYRAVSFPPNKEFSCQNVHSRKGEEPQGGWKERKQKFQEGKKCAFRNKCDPG